MRKLQFGVILLVLATISLAGCKKDCKLGEDVACWMEALQTPELAEKAVGQLKDLNDKEAEPALVAAFLKAADQPKLREDIAEIFGKWKTKTAVKPMMDAINLTAGPSKDGRKAKATNRANQKIATALGAIGDLKAADHIRRLMKVTKDPYVKRSAIRSLGKIKAKDAIDDLLEIMLDKNEKKPLRANAVFALGEIGDPKVVSVMVKALYMEKAYFFAHANLALVKIGDPAVDLLIQTLKGKNKEVKVLLESSMGILDGALEANAAQVLGDIGSNKATEALLEMVEKVMKWEAETNRLLVLVRLINALGDVGDKRAIAPIMKVLDSKYWDVRTVIGTALINIGDRSVVPKLIEVAGTGTQHPRTRVPMVDAIGNLGTDADLAKLEELKKKHKDRDLTPAIEKAILRVTVYGECKQNLDCWIGKLKDKDSSIREKAIYELGRLGDKKAVDPLMGLLADQNVNVRWALVDAFTKLNSPKPIASIVVLVNVTEKGSTRFKEVNEKYKRLAARLLRTAK